jgi:GTP-binding protein Era
MPLTSSLNATSQPVYVVINKIDLLHSTSTKTSITTPNKKNLTEIQTFWASQLPRAQVLTISASKRQNTTSLLDLLLSHLPIGPKYYPDVVVTDRNERFFAAEIIRESLFILYQKEIPYSCEVVIEEFQDISERFTRIEARIVVERHRQKAIVIGAQGNALKQLGIQARRQLEAFLDRKVHLALQVDVDEGWRSKPESLLRYGYIEKD